MSCGCIVCTCNGARTTLMPDINSETPIREPISVEDSIKLFNEAMENLKNPNYKPKKQSFFKKILSFL